MFECVFAAFFSRSDYIGLYFPKISETTQRIVKILFLVERVMNYAIPDYFSPPSLKGTICIIYGKLPKIELFRLLAHFKIVVNFAQIKI